MIFSTVLLQSRLLAFRAVAHLRLSLSVQCFVHCDGGDAGANLIDVDQNLFVPTFDNVDGVIDTDEADSGTGIVLVAW